MKLKYWVFAGETYYAAGGVCALQGRFENQVEAEEWLRKSQHGFEWYQIVDVENAVVVRHHGGGGYGTDGTITCGCVDCTAPEDEGDRCLVPDC